MVTEERMRKLLEQIFVPSELKIKDQSRRHAGHKEAKEHGGGHYDLLIVSEAFCDKTPVERHRAIYDALKEELQSAIHALSIQAFTPSEWQEE